MSAEVPRREQPKKLSASRRRLRFLTFVMFCFVSWAGLTFVDQYGAFKEKTDRLAELESKLEETKRVNEQYQLQIIRLHDPEYIEQLLKKELHMTKEGETLIIETD